MELLDKSETLQIIDDLIPLLDDIRVLAATDKVLNITDTNNLVRLELSAETSNTQVRCKIYCKQDSMDNCIDQQNGPIFELVNNLNNRSTIELTSRGELIYKSDDVDAPEKKGIQNSRESTQDNFLFLKCARYFMGSQVLLASNAPVNELESDQIAIIRNSEYTTVLMDIIFDNIWTGNGEVSYILANKEFILKFNITEYPWQIILKCGDITSTIYSLPLSNLFACSSKNRHLVDGFFTSVTQNTAKSINSKQPKHTLYFK